MNFLLRPEMRDIGAWRCPMCAAADARMVALIWGAHIGFDRALGYGLKYPTSFQDTHLGRLGRARDRVAAG